MAKNTTASPDSTYGNPPVRVMKKVPSKAIVPKTAQTAVTILAVKSFVASLYGAYTARCILIQDPTDCGQFSVRTTSWPDA